MKNTIIAMCAALGITAVFVLLMYSFYPHAPQEEVIDDGYFFTPIMLSEPHKTNEYQKETAIPDSVNIVYTTIQEEEEFETEVVHKEPHKKNTIKKSAENASNEDTADIVYKKLTARQININNKAIVPYIDYFEESSAPKHGAGLWLGSDNTTDGTWGYFIGHNPGDFSPVMDLVEGDSITVCDHTESSRTYYVVDVFTVDTSTYWSDIEERVTSYGESIILQTCVGDNAHYRVVVAC